MHNLFNKPTINIEARIGGYTVSVGLNFNSSAGSITATDTMLFEHGRPKLFDTQTSARSAMESWLSRMYEDGYLASIADFNNRPGICDAARLIQKTPQTSVSP